MERFKFQFWLTNIVAVMGEGQEGGIVVFWRRGVDVNVQNFLDNHIDMDVREDDLFVWRFIDIYRNRDKS
jgi:hypothetical protein